jgi:hypothetical protein
MSHANPAWQSVRGEKQFKEALTDFHRIPSEFQPHLRGGKAALILTVFVIDGDKDSATRISSNASGMETNSIIRLFR